MDASVVKRLRMAAGEMISLCAHRLGISLTAAKGKFTASALTDGMDLFAQKQLRVASESADVQVSAKSKITLNSGGASLDIEGGNMTFRCPGAFTIKAGSFTFVGPDNTPTPLPSLPKSSPKICDSYPSSH
jgi:type VI secretion system secreted protein VgrG